MSAATAAELKPLVKTLNSNASTEEDLVTILNNLKHRTKITEAVLRESKAGLAVGKLRSHTSKAVSDLAKEIVKKWKTEVEREKQAAGGGSGAKATPKPSVAKKVTAVTPSTPVTPTISNGDGKASDTRSAKRDGIKIETTGDKTRDKCVELIYDALVFDSGEAGERVLKCAHDIEKTAHIDNKGTTPEYRAKMRSLFVNLKDKNNANLRRNILSGELSASRVPRMTNKELASKERKEADAQIEKDNLFKTLGAGDQEAETSAFQCGRCKQWKTRYRQAQTRSADEPMTTFVTCVNCGNRWKFS